MSRMNRWMSYIPDNTSLSALSIPGTHDSATYVVDTPAYALAVSGGWALLGPIGAAAAARGLKYIQTQSATIVEQLNMGIRFLDLRVASNSDGELIMHHGSIPLFMPLTEIFDDIAKFLVRNPKEVVVVSVKKDSGNDSTEHVNELLGQIIDGNSLKFYLGCEIPKLGDVRGKAVLINRIAQRRSSKSAEPFGIHIAFPDNQSKMISAPQISGKTLRIAIQDIYEPDTGGSESSLTNKREHVERAYRKFSKEFYHLRLNFISATQFPTRTPGEFADGLNQKINAMLFEETFTIPWITVMDYVGKYGSGKDDPISAIVSMNPLSGLKSAEGATDAKSNLQAGEDLTPGMVLWSPSGAFNVRFQDDGNLVVYRVIDGVPMRASGTHGKGATHVSMQTDGNLVVYRGKKPLASTETYGIGENCFLSMRDDGGLVLYNSRQDSVWNSRTHDFKRHF